MNYKQTVMTFQNLETNYDLQWPKVDSTLPLMLFMLYTVYTHRESHMF